MSAESSAPLGISLTERGGVICQGALKLFRNNKAVDLRSHRQVLLDIFHWDFNTHMRVVESTAELDRETGLYPHFDDLEQSQINFHFPKPMTEFLWDHLSKFRPALTETLSLSSNQSLDRKSYSLGHVEYALPHSDECIQLDVLQTDITVEVDDDAARLSLSAQLRSRGKKQKSKVFPDKEYDIDAAYRLEGQFFINKETLNFRFDHKIAVPQVSSFSIGSPAKAEVTSDIDNVNLENPLIYNTGGTYAIGKDRIYLVIFAQDNCIIRHASLGRRMDDGVYENQIRSYEHQLTLSGLTKRYLETVISTLAFEDDWKLRYNTSWDRKNLGSFMEDGIGGKEPYSLNERKVKTAAIDICLDQHGLLLKIACKLSDMLPTTERTSKNPQQGPNYKVELLLPWEVLIFRDFKTGRYRTYFGLKKKREEKLGASSKSLITRFFKPFQKRGKIFRSNYDVTATERSSH